MPSGIYENESQLKEIYIKTNLFDHAQVQATIAEIETNAYTASKPQYLLALHHATPANIKKAKTYQSLSKNFILKNSGWIIMAIFAIWIGLQDWETDSTLQSLGFWVGVGIQIYVSVLKNTWTKLTLAGTVIHPVLISTPASAPTAVPNTNACTQSNNCSNCGQPNKDGALFCENCGATLNH